MKPEKRIDVLLINGITLPYHLLDKGLQRIRDERSDIRIIFMYRNVKKDSAASIKAVLTRPDFIEYSGHKNLEKLIRSNLTYVNSFFGRHALTIDTKIVPNPNATDIIEMMEDVQNIYVDHDTFIHPGDFAFVNFPYSELEASLQAKLQKVVSPASVTPQKKKALQFF